jgi:ATP-binding cassette subfamily C protein CydCD
MARVDIPLDTPVGSGGTGISAGQRQRVALARAFLRDAPILLLDEPTANLDAATEAEVVDAIRSHARGRTVLLVAHRPALLALADRVVCLPLPASLQDLPNGSAPNHQVSQTCEPGPSASTVDSNQRVRT